MAQSKCSAFKSVNDVENINKLAVSSSDNTQSESSLELKFKKEKEVITQTRIVKQNNNNENNSFECMSSSSSSSSASCSSTSSDLSNKNQLINTPPTAAGISSPLFPGHPQSLSPFYVDKIFNFQNMYLFSSNGNSSVLPSKSTADNMPVLPSSLHMNNPHVFNPSMDLASQANLLNESESLLSPLFSHTKNDLDEDLIFCRNKATSHSLKINQEIKTIMQHNLLQNYYNLFNLNHQNNLKQQTENEMKLESNLASPSKVTNNFSIERILSLPSKQQIGKHVDTSSSSSSTLCSTLGHQSTMTKLNNQNNSRDKNRNYATTNNSVSSSYLANFPQFTHPIAITAPIPIDVHQTNVTNDEALVKTEKQKKSLYNVSNSLQHPPVPKSKNAKKYKCDLCGRFLHC
jgi:hypothetical protein